MFFDIMDGTDGSAFAEIGHQYRFRYVRFRVDFAATSFLVDLRLLV